MLIVPSHTSMKTKMIPLPLAMLLVQGAWAPGVRAQSAEELKALKKEVEALKESQRAIEKDLQLIKSLLFGRREAAPFREAVINLEKAPYLGEKNAKVTLVEFTDYQCPFCARHASQVLPQIVSEYVKTGKLKYAVRHFPLESMHPAAAKASEAALCAGEQGKFWEMHYRLLADPRALAATNLSEYAGELKLELAGFQRCLESGKYLAKVREDLAEGQQAGVNGTPSFFLGLTGAVPARLQATMMLEGAQPFLAFKEAIDSLLGARK